MQIINEMKKTTFIFSSLLLLFHVASSFSPRMNDFAFIALKSLQPQQERTAPRLCASDAKEEYDIESASVQLMWERTQESGSRPLLDFSSRSASLEELDSTTTTPPFEGNGAWCQGQRWTRTREGLNELEIEVNDSFLAKCPQLLRLNPSMVLETAKWIVDEFGIDYVRSEPRLLSYPLKDVEYGLDFMSTMMMADAKPACRASTALFLSSIDGGIQEQAVKVALGAAGDATSKASQTIAGDAMTSLKKLKDRKSPF
eukprot:scaffold1727_cov133-Cylindrotheca_fusiformis.AAC.33